MKSVGYCALLRLSLCERLCAAACGLTDYILSPGEKKIWAKCVTKKRRLEFLGGRCAGKIVASLYRLGVGLDLTAWDAIEILPGAGGVPACRHADGLRHSLSISHTKNFALAVASADGQRVGADIEESGAHVRPTADMFHHAELCQIHDGESARLRWTLKEMYGKLTGDGIFGRTQSLVTLRHAGRLWLGVTAQMSSTGPAILTSGYWGELAVSIGFDSGAGGKSIHHGPKSEGFGRVQR